MKNCYGGDLRAIRLAKRITAQTLCAKLQLKGWDVSEDVINSIEAGRRILADSELTLILLCLRAKPADLPWPPKD